ncbi:hypothetical protein KIK06_23745 [Nocardiopsis sp. EMB25]|uniref:hypothetical protein n=1 Tax=Nocardiopsis sp. EMB25 TaxID=2835867 RepID=UPI002284B705|nr:hypothetical protein [Nocardiopsis sp. EMB25]MCY9786901.1 hypothetical protein [Nocardiopsis sp. EMB25]
MIDDHPWGDNFEGPDPGPPRRHEEAPPTPGTAVDAVGLALVCAPRAATDPIGRVQAVLRAAANPPL